MARVTPGKYFPSYTKTPLTHTSCLTVVTRHHYCYLQIAQMLSTTMACFEHILLLSVLYWPYDWPCLLGVARRREVPTQSKYLRSCKFWLFPKQTNVLKLVKGSYDSIWLLPDTCQKCTLKVAWWIEFPRLTVGTESCAIAVPEYIQV